MTVQTQATWRSGVYVAKLTAEGGTNAGKSSYALFVVRDDASQSAILYQVSLNTFQAYNSWGGHSVYRETSVSGQRATKVSFLRPYGAGFARGAGKGVGAGDYIGNQLVSYAPFGAGWEYNMVRFLDREGYDVTYTTDNDVARRPQLLLNHRAFLSVGHDEYWTMDQRNAIVAARDAGVHLGFFGANIGYWQVRLEPSTSGLPDRTMVSYKDATLDPVTGPLQTILFRDLTPPLPENQILGVMYNGGSQFSGDYSITDVSTWVTDGTGLVVGSVLTGVLGSESDIITQFLNATHRRIAHGCVNGACGDVSLYTAASGAQVFAVGSFQWSWGLDDYNTPDLRPSVLSAAVQQMTRNVLNRFVGGASPVPVASVAVSLGSASLQPGGTTQATATLTDAAGNVLTGRSVVWSSSNPAVATVSPSGVVTAVAPGRADVVATSEGKSGQATLTVTTPPPAPVATVAVSVASPSLGIGQTTPATATLKDAAGNTLTGRTVTWSSSNPVVATVDATTGVVRGIALGTAVITATSEGKSGSATVTVVLAPVATVTVTIVNANIIVNQTSQATATLKDAAGNTLTGRTITWTSSNPKVATVSTTGLVRALASGSAEITATSEGKSGSVRVKTRK